MAASAADPVFTVAVLLSMPAAAAFVEAGVAGVIANQKRTLTFLAMDSPMLKEAVTICQVLSRD